MIGRFRVAHATVEVVVHQPCSVFPLMVFVNEYAIDRDSNESVFGERECIGAGNHRLGLQGDSHFVLVRRSLVGPERATRTAAAATPVRTAGAAARTTARTTAFLGTATAPTTLFSCARSRASVSRTPAGFGGARAAGLA